MNLSKYLMLIALACLITNCKKSGEGPSDDFKVTITCSAPFSWDIDEYVAGQNFTTIDTSNVNSNAVNYSLKPIIGQTVSVYARSANISDLKAVITYKGQTLGPVSTVSDASSGTTVSFDYVVN